MRHMKINFQVITLMEYVYPVLMMRIWYEQNHRSLTPTHLLNDSMDGKLDKVVTDALVDALKFEDHITRYKNANPGMSVIFLN